MLPLAKARLEMVYGFYMDQGLSPVLFEEDHPPLDPMETEREGKTVYHTIQEANAADARKQDR
jgi:hypothetical protein